MKDTKNISSDLNSDPEYIKLQKEHLSLIIAQQKRDIKRSEIQVISDRIEQARRNVEVITRVIDAIGSLVEDDIRKKISDILAVNIEILKEVKDIK